MSETLDRINSDDYKAIITIFDDRMKDIIVRGQDFNDLKSVVRDLADAQKRTEPRLDSLTVKVEELAEAQRKTEQRLGSLTIKVGELAEAQRKTEQTVNFLLKTQKKMQKELGGLSATIGYTLKIGQSPGSLKCSRRKSGFRLT